MAIDKERDKKRSKLIKKIARKEFIEYNMLTKIIKDKTIYCRKSKHPKKDE
jgi:hypothetical protein